MAAKEQNPTQHEITAQLADLNETMQREKVELTPEVKRYFNENLARLTDKLAKNEHVYINDLEFIENIKKWIKMSKPYREKLPSIEEMENPKLTQEQKEKLFVILRSRFMQHKKRHLEIKWSRVKESLNANEKAMWSINEMEEAGHEPDVYNSDEEGFDIGTCSKETPINGRDCVYDSEIERIIKKETHYREFKGNAEDMAAEMMIELMDKVQYRDFLQPKGKFDRHSKSWLKTPPETRKTGKAYLGSSEKIGYEISTKIEKTVVFMHYYDDIGWRGSLRVPWKK